MKKEHPFCGGVLLAAVLVLMMTLFGTRGTAAFSGKDRELLMMAAGVPVGALAASLPGRICRRKETRLRSAPLRCVIAFGAGMVMLLAARVAGLDGLGAVSGAMQGGVGALVFVVIAWLAALAASRFAEGRLS